MRINPRIGIREKAPKLILNGQIRLQKLKI
jgi:hypothetical protein